MQRTDYISLDDTDKLNTLAFYYVDYFNNLPVLLQGQDHIVIGRRGTGKSTLLYRGYIECLRSWDETLYNDPHPGTLLQRILPVYIDLNQCTSVMSEDLDGRELESAFLGEIVRHLSDQVGRFWPKPVGLTSRLERLVGKSPETKVHEAVTALSKTLLNGKPLLSRKAQVERESELRSGDSGAVQASTGTVGAKAAWTSDHTEKKKESYEVSLSLTAAEFISGLRALRQAADISAIMVFVDEFSSLDRSRQRRIARVLKTVNGHFEFPDFGHLEFPTQGSYVAWGRAGSVSRRSR